MRHLLTLPLKVVALAAFLYLALGIWLVPPGTIIGAF